MKTCWYCPPNFWSFVAYFLFNHTLMILLHSRPHFLYFLRSLPLLPYPSRLRFKASNKTHNQMIDPSIVSSFFFWLNPRRQQHSQENNRKSADEVQQTLIFLLPSLPAINHTRVVLNILPRHYSIFERVCLAQPGMPQPLRIPFIEYQNSQDQKQSNE